MNLSYRDAKMWITDAFAAYIDESSGDDGAEARRKIRDAVLRLFERLEFDRELGQFVVKNIVKTIESSDAMDADRLRHSLKNILVFLQVIAYRLDPEDHA